MSSKWSCRAPQYKRLAIAATVAIASLSMALPSYSLQFPRSSNRGAPARTAGGGVRGNACVSTARNKLQFTALIPENNVSTTVSTSSTLLFYVPASESKVAELLLMDSDGNDLHTDLVPLPSSGGIIQVRLPEKTKAGEPLLKPNQDYIWRFAIICDASDRTRDLPLDGTVRRVAPTPELQAALRSAQGNPLKQAEAYANAGIWQETALAAVALYNRDPQPWQGLLKSIKLDALTTAQFAKSGQPCDQTKAAQTCP
jgi:hypothetical protein